jgi:hypothetical protein
MSMDDEAACMILACIKTEYRIPKNCNIPRHRKQRRP